jgi:hypothetical protein
MVRQPHIDRFDIDERTSDTQPPQQGAPLVYGKAIDADRLVPLSAWAAACGTGSAQQLIPILPENHPRYRESRGLISETIERWDRGDFR